MKPDPNEYVLSEDDVLEPRSGECADKQKCAPAGAGEPDVLQAEEIAKLAEHFLHSRVSVAAGCFRRRD